MQIKSRILLPLLTVFFALNAQKQSPLFVDSLQLNWVNKTYDSLSLDQKIGQLFMIAAYSNKGPQHEAFIARMVEQEGVGGLIFMQDDANKQLELTNRYQSIAKTPLLIGMDAEWDLSMRLKGTHKFPWAMTLGAVQNNDLIYQMGNAMANHARRLGVHINFAPVVDVNTNPNNPIIGNRSYGSNVNNVAQKGIAITRGMQDFNVLASAKHFPGHGDTSSDSHKTLPTVKHGIERLEKIELAPFKQLIDANVASIMVAHLNVPTLESNPKYPSSISKKVVTGLLKEKLGFQGLIITDALNMKAVANAFPPGVVDAKAFAAGNDILLFSQAVNTGKAQIKKALNNGEISMDRIEESVKKILMAKYKVGLHKPQTLNPSNLMAELNRKEAKALNTKLYANAITVLKNTANTLPIKDLANEKIAYVSLESGEKGSFHKYLNKYTKVDRVSVRNVGEVSKLKAYSTVIVGVHKSNASPYKSYKISSGSRSIINAIGAQNNAILVSFASPYSLKNVTTTNLESVVLAYQNNTEMHKLVPQVLFGAIPAKGMLPAKVNSELEFGKSITVNSIARLGYDLPENQGMDSKILEEIDGIAQEAIAANAAPGMQVLVARNGKVVYEKAFGNYTYLQKKKTELDAIYDIASVTKITSTLPLVMKQVGEGKLSMSQTLGDILPDAKNTNKSNIRLKDMLAHKSGLKAWIGFYKETVNIKNARLYLDFYSRTPNEDFNIKVDDNIFLTSNYRDSIRKQIYESPLGSKRYKYSDLGYYLLQDYLENTYKKSLDLLAHEHFYAPLGMNRTTYKPQEKFTLEEIVPTEKDKLFRNQLVHGFVHDQGAAMQGGVAGHAGLFSTATDLAKIMQMYLNGGSYGGQQFIKPEVLQTFTSYQFKAEKNRRGLGFDKKQLGRRGPASASASSLSFGHTGFTGTMVWADPAEQLVYVFLSNRVHPDAENKKLIRMNTRSKIMELMYDSIKSYKKENPPLLTSL